MTLTRYKYAPETIRDTGEGVMIDLEDVWTLDKNLEGRMGVLFAVQCTYGGSATRGLTVQVVQSISSTVPNDSPEAAAISFDMPLLGFDTRVTVPVLLPEVGPNVRLRLVNNTGDTVWAVVWSRMIDGVEVA